MTTTAFQSNLAAARSAQHLIAAALVAENEENLASAEGHPEWETFNNTKWAAFQEAAEAMGPKAVRVLDESEDEFLSLLETFQAQPQMLAKWMA